MNNPNDYVGLSLAKSYMAERLEYERTRRLLKQNIPKKPGRVYCATCQALVSIGRLLVAFGRRLERFDLVLQDSKV
jgi:hypothetical protein